MGFSRESLRGLAGSNVRRSWPSVVRRYGVGLAGVLVATILRRQLDPWLGDLFPFATLFLAVLAAAGHGGFGPALLATIAGALAATWYLLPPRHSWVVAGPENQAGLLLYVLVSLGIAVLGGFMRSSRQRAQALAAEAVGEHQRLRTTLASIGDAVIVTDACGQVTLMNPVAERLTGWAAADAGGRPLAEVLRLLNEQTRAGVESPVARVLREGAVVGLANHTVLIARDGTERPIDDSAAPVRDEAGRLAGVVLVFRDVTERRRADQAARSLAAIVESSEDAIYGKTLDGVVTSWNRSAEQLFGYSAAEIVGRPIALLVPPEQSAQLAAIMERVRRGEKTDHFETRRRRRDGTLVDVSVTISPVRDAAGRIVGASSIARDITERKRTEANLRFLSDSSAALAAVVDYESTLRKVARLAVPYFADWCVVDMAQPDGALRRLEVVHSDPAKVELANELQRRFPPRPDDPYGPAHVLRTGRPEMAGEITQEILGATARDEDHLRLLRGLGLRSYICVPLSARGQTLGVITFITSESGRRYGDQDLALAQDLANRAAVAIDNARLYGELREADRRKDEFLALLGHELRNPLAPVSNALHILKAPGVDPAVAERARGMMGRQVEALVRLVDDLLHVSRIMRGKVELRREPVELADAVRRAVETVQPLIDAEGHELTVSLPPEPLRVHGDVVRLAQVVANLLGNAAKYTERGGRIWLTAERDDVTAVIRVRDTGIGISPHVLPRIFDMFFQAQRRTKDAQGGLGIGLSLVRGLVELHGGTVEAHSAGRGQGSEFVVRLPLLERDDGRQFAAPDGRGVAGRPARRILVVDDSTDAADSLALLLRSKGHEVGVAYDGPAALARAAADPPAVAFIDLGMPLMDGFELARQFRAHPVLRRAMLIALTGWGQPEDRRRSKEAGFDEHLTKPVDPGVLEALFDRAVPAK